MEMPASIPVANRRVFITNTGHFSFKTRNEILPLFIDKIDSLINRLTDEWSNKMRGIIHSASYANAEEIIRKSKYKKHMVIPKYDELINIDKFMESNLNKIIVSPSMLEGVDLKDDFSRFQIFFKVPYANLKDNWIKEKMNIDKKWYARDTILKIVQGSGRSIRSKDDWAFTFVLDSNINRLLKEHQQMFPKWFLESVFFI
jgi:ATP-dependent DNA helicase DinG